MLTFGIPLALSLIGAYIFLGIKISESILNEHVRVFFWALYLVTLFTLINISISIYFYSTILHKRGPLGERGSKGFKGETGKDGTCISSDCKPKTVRLMIEKEIEKLNNENDITPEERKYICNMVNQDDNKEAINKLELEEFKQLKKEVSGKLGKTDKKTLNQRMDGSKEYIKALKKIKIVGIDFSKEDKSDACDL